MIDAAEAVREVPVVIFRSVSAGRSVIPLDVSFSVVIGLITQADIEIACSLHELPGFKLLHKKRAIGASHPAASVSFLLALWALCFYL